MSLREVLFGKPIPDENADEERIHVVEGVPFLGLDALASASYGPEAALTVLLVVGVASLQYIIPISLVIIGLLLVVQFSYRQTIGAYPNGGGSYTVSRENLGRTPGLIAAAALALDYILNVAVAISAGVGALVSAIPELLPHTRNLALLLLLVITTVNLRGVRSTGRVFMVPTYLFVLCLGATIVLGVAKVVLSGGHPTPVVAPPPAPLATASISVWLLLRAFSSGCTAMTGIEAVSNAVPVFCEPKVRTARRTLTAIVVILGMLLAGVALLSHAYGIHATPPGQSGFQSVLSQLLGAVTGRGVFYYVSIAAIVSVLCLSANTSFADFPRLCRVLALDRNLPETFAHSGPRLVYSTGIIVLAVLSGALILLFGGVTDHLIPLFAIGAFSAFTLSQLGMVMHWRKQRHPRALRFMIVNGVGAAATGVTLLVVTLSKFSEGAWLTLVFMPFCVALFHATNAHYARVDRLTTRPRAISLDRAVEPPIVVVPIKHLDLITEKGIGFAVAISPEVYAVHICARGGADHRHIEERWRSYVEEPLRRAGRPIPRFVVLTTRYRQLVDPLLRYVRKLGASNPHRFVAVLVPELVEHRWYHYLLHSHTASLLKMKLLFRGGPQVVVINTPWYLREPRRHRKEAQRRRHLKPGVYPGRPLRET